jgi:hypothetical protein
LKLPLAAMTVTPAVIRVPVSPPRPAGLKKIAEPSGQGLAAAVPARPIVQVPCSYTPNP